MTTDTCQIYVIPAIERTLDNKRVVWIILDKDGDWYKSYEGNYNSEIIYKP